jgi:hypothetical protein
MERDPNVLDFHTGWQKRKDMKKKAVKQHTTPDLTAEKELKARLTITLPPSIKDILENDAKRQVRTNSQQIELILRKHYGLEVLADAEDADDAA